jgi:hypothetical protein
MDTEPLRDREGNSPREVWKEGLKRIYRECPYTMAIFSEVIFREELTNGFAQESSMESGVTTKFGQSTGKAAGFCESRIGSKTVSLATRAPDRRDIVVGMAMGASTLTNIAHERLHAWQSSLTPYELAEAQCWRTYNRPLGDCRPEDVFGDEDSKFYKDHFGQFNMERFIYGVEAVDKLMAMGISPRQISKIFGLPTIWIDGKSVTVEWAIRHYRKKHSLTEVDLHQRVERLGETLKNERQNIRGIAAESLKKIDELKSNQSPA